MSLQSASVENPPQSVLERAQAQGLLRHIDLAFARFIQARAGSEAPESIALAAALTSHALSEGHSCLDLAAVADNNSFRAAEPAGGLQEHRNPSLTSWLAALQACRLVGAPGDNLPLILDGSRLYLQRYWRYEVDVAEHLRQRAGVLDAQDAVSTRAYFQSPDPIDWQAVAAAVALDNRVTVIAGGPGTGKTYTVLRLLAALLQQHDLELEIRLAAPTGKAAARVTQSIQKGTAGIADERIRAAIPSEASTIHRLLGSLGDGQRFRHDQSNPLSADVVVIDECSMVDLPLMAKLLRALKPRARLILIGDPHQLASVETGNVLTEICASTLRNTFSAEACARIERRSGYRPPAAKDATGGFGDAVITLEKSQRFGSAVGALVSAIHPAPGTDRQDPIEVFAARDELALEPIDAATLKERLTSIAAGSRPGPDKSYFAGLFNASDPEEALKRLEDFQILTALRRGPFGAEAINRQLEKELRRLADTTADFYPGRPVMIVQNDYRQGLFNGDVGVTMADASGRLWVWFRKPDGELQQVLPSQLGPHEPAYAITIHKSQGSEYEHVVMVLPDEFSEFLTRELVYTGVSRARERLTVWTEEEVLHEACDNPLRRYSGLGERLAGR